MFFIVCEYSLVKPSATILCVTEFGPQHNCQFGPCNSLLWGLSCVLQDGQQHLWSLPTGGQQHSHPHSTPQCNNQNVSRLLCMMKIAMNYKRVIILTGVLKLPVYKITCTGFTVLLFQHSSDLVDLDRSQGILQNDSPGLVLGSSFQRK